MKRFIIFMEENNDEENRFYFPCDADDTDHAEEQALNAYPNARCVTLFVEVQS